VEYQRAVLEAGMTRPGHRGLREHGKHLQSVQHPLLNEADNMRRNGNVNHVASAINRPASGIRQPQQLQRQMSSLFGGFPSSLRVPRAI
jgi:hypothetical protein